MGAVGPGAALKANLIVEFFSDYSLKNMIDGNLVFPRPPDEIINKRGTQRWTYIGEGVYCVGMGAGG